MTQVGILSNFHKGKGVYYVGSRKFNTISLSSSWVSILWRNLIFEGTLGSVGRGGPFVALVRVELQSIIHHR